MFRRTGNAKSADEAYARALDLVGNQAERRFLEERREALGLAPGG